ncbi:hypothetical protein ACGFNV_27750 [Streptomyces sp. NPDC048751]|uniref:hypothetical protein n=1 Tax=Streptomyces sp. NPDC048751 TaxID=3365591 RepID=UPI00371CE7D2
MGVIDSQWWGLWWPWLTVWALTAACCVVLLRYALVRPGRRRRRGRRGGPTVLGMCFYLHKQRVMDIYETGRFSESLAQEVADRINVTSNYGLWGKLFSWVGGKADRGVTKERVTTYLRESTPMNVIGVLMDTMRRDDGVVDADLVTGRMTPNRALADLLRDGAVDGRVPLSAVMSDWVSVTARFTARRTESGDVVLRARYGTGEPAAHVKITCAEAEGRGEFRDEDYYTGEFPARCLGKVRTWDPRRGELTLDPVAIFR